jgi:hypothetical protein
MPADTRKIEQKSIIYLKDYLTDSNYIEPYIDENDKTPCWDGYIFLYNSTNKKAENLNNKIDVQVKGEINETTDSQITYSIKKYNLRNYYISGGIAYYVVRMTSDLKKKSIYYAHLTKIQLRRYINYCEENGFESTSIYLEKVPDDVSEYTELLFNFSKDVSKDIPIRNLSLEDILKSEEFDGLSIKYVGVKYKDDPYDYIFNHPTTVYAHSKETGIDIPIQEDVHFTSIVITDSGSVKIKGIQYYSSIKRERQKDKVILYIGRSIEFTFTKNAEKMNLNFHYDIKGTLSERINDSRFLLDFIDNRGFYLDDKELKLPFTDEQINSINIEAIKNDLNFYEKIKELLDKFGVKKELDYSLLTEQDKRTFCLLIDTVLFGAKLKRTQSDPFILQTLNIANISFMFGIFRISEDECKIVDFFHEKFLCTFKPEASPEEVPFYNGSQFFVLEEKDFESVDNINYEIIASDILKLNLSDEVVEYINMYVLIMLLAFDKQEVKDKALIDCICKINDFLIKENNSCKTIFLLNKYQALARVSVLSKSVRNELLEIASETDKIQNKIGAYLILGDREQAQFYYEKLTEPEKEEFNQYPINYFWENSYEC